MVSAIVSRGNAMSNVNSNAKSAAAVTLCRSYMLFGSPVKTWTTGFTLATAALLAAQPTAIVTGAIALCLMFVMALVTLASVTNVEDQASFDAKQLMVTVLAPVQFACLIWMAVQAGRMIAGVSLATSSLAALGALAIIVLIDAVLSIVFLLVAERGQGVSGVSVAALISSKYAGLLGKIA
jgi:hypothetical protein